MTKGAISTTWRTRWDVFENLDIARLVEMFRRYLDLSGQTISRAQAQERMFAKLANPRFLLDLRPLLPAAQAEALTEEATADSFRRVFTMLIDRLPGEPCLPAGLAMHNRASRSQPAYLRPKRVLLSAGWRRWRRVRAA